MPNEDHKAIAPLFRATFSNLALQQSEDVVRGAYRRGLARMAYDSSRCPEGVRGRPYFERPVLEAMAGIFLGLPPGDPRLDDLSRSLAALAFQGLPLGNWRQGVMAGLTTTIGIMREVEAGWAGSAGNGAPSALRSLVDAVPNALDDPTLAGNFAVILRIASSDLVGFHDWIFKFLSDHPSALAPVRAGEAFAESRPGPQPGPATRIVMETLRLQQAEYLYRTATQPIEFDGYVIPAGWLFRLCIQESHRDPTVFPDPDRFDPERFTLRAYSRTEYSPFGADAHGCMGSQLALFMGGIFVEELARGFEWRVVSDGPVERSWRHSSHWKPSEGFRVIMTPRADRVEG
jgi:cytochrome P450